MRVAIRAASPDDCRGLAALSTQLGYPMSPEEAEERRSRIADHPDHALLVAEVDGRIAGWIQVSLPRAFETALQAEIAGLVVDEASRSRGIGGRLLAASESWAREHGCRAVRVRSNVVRERAHGFYRRAGFRQTKTQRVFEKCL